MLRLLKFLGVLLLALVIVIAAYIGVNWAPDKSVDELAGRWAQPPSQFVEVMGMQVHLRDEMAEGADPEALPVVLLHGTSDSLHTWQGWTDVLSQQRRVIRFDLPGFGLTGPFPAGDYRMAHYTQFVLAMLDELDVPRAIVAGNSFGGQLAWETAYAAPERVAALVLVDAAGYLFETQSMPIGFRIAQIPGLNELMNRVLPRGMVESSVRSVYGNPDRVTPALVDRYYDLTLREGNRAALAARFREARGTEDAPARLATLNMPTLIIWGDQDRLIPPDSATRFHQDLPNNTLRLFPGLGHVPQEEDPSGTVEAVQTFLAEQSVP